MKIAIIIVIILIIAALIGTIAITGKSDENYRGAHKSFLKHCCFLRENKEKNHVKNPFSLEIKEKRAGCFMRIAYEV